MSAEPRDELENQCVELTTAVWRDEYDAIVRTGSHAFPPSPVVVEVRRWPDNATDRRFNARIVGSAGFFGPTPEAALTALRDQCAADMLACIDKGQRDAVALRARADAMLRAWEESVAAAHDAEIRSAALIALRADVLAHPMNPARRQRTRRRRRPMSKAVTDEEIDALERRAFDMMKSALDNAYTMGGAEPKGIAYATTAARLAETFAALRSARRGT